METLMKEFPDGLEHLWLDSTVRADYMLLLPQIPLYDYQVEATTEMLKHHNGILQAPAGSGKTQMGLSLIATLGKRALWITHTKDLLNQSKERAERYWPSEVLGTITEGKVDIGSHVTFATVQTMSHMNLSQYSKYWDVIITDECHRVAGSPTAVTMFSKVLNSLQAQFKYGLSATVHRADGLIRCTFALVGPVQVTVPKSAVQKTVMPVTVRPRSTGVTLSRDCIGPDGMIIYQKLIKSLVDNENRNEMIVSDICQEWGHSCLVLSDRVGHLKHLRSMLPRHIWADSAIIDGSMVSKVQKEIREESIEQMRTGKLKVLFATYALAREGLDIPRLDRLFMVTPQKDYAVITQSIGRIARRFDGKDTAIAYDYVDSIQSLVKAYKRRCTTYRKEGCTIEE
jgi:superfamily II DNA or RNA helicase